MYALFTEVNATESSIEAGRTYDFRMHESNLKFFDPATGLRVPARPLPARRSA